MHSSYSSLVEGDDRMRDYLYEYNVRPEFRGVID